MKCRLMEMTLEAKNVSDRSVNYDELIKLSKAT